MKKVKHPMTALAAAIIVAVFQTSGRAQIVIGTGPDLVNLVIQAPAFGPLWYQYHYDAANFSDPRDPLRGADVLVAVTADPALSKLSLNYSGQPDSGFFVNSLAYNGGQPLASDFGNNNFYWTYFASGGAVNEVDQFFSPRVDSNGVPVVDPIPAGAWSLSPVGASLRYPVDGSWDALVFGEWKADPPTSDNVVYAGDQPAISPVPEPQGVALLFGGMVFLAIRLIRRGSFARAGA
jgi:hypothetical protein